MKASDEMNDLFALAENNGIAASQVRTWLLNGQTPQEIRLTIQAIGAGRAHIETLQRQHRCDSVSQER